MLQTLLHELQGFGAGNWISTVMAATALIALCFQWKENRRRDREMLDLKELAVGLEKESHNRKNSITFLLQQIDLLKHQLWTRIRWNEDVLRKRRILIHDQQALTGLVFRALAPALGAHPARDKILALVAEIGEKQRFLNSQLIGWAEAESEAVSKYDREIERLMQVHLTPEQEQRELDAIQGVYRRTDEQVSAHYDPLVARAKKELADLGSDLFDICESPTET
jgi:hypothetical protein